MIQKVFNRSLLIVIAFVMLPAAALSGDVVDIFKAKEAVKKYHSSGQYDRDVTQVADRAIAYLKECIKKKRKKLAVVFDIDETLLSNYSYQAESTDFGYIPSLWNRWIEKAEAAPIKPVRRLLRTAVDSGASVFIITGRRENQKAATIRNLKAAGCEGFKKLYLKPVNYKGTAQAYKSALRKKIEDAGFTVVVNIGDQYSDLKGGYAEKTFKLPNHIYFIP